MSGFQKYYNWGSKVKLQMLRQTFISGCSLTSDNLFNFSYEMCFQLLEFNCFGIV